MDTLIPLLIYSSGGLLGANLALIAFKSVSMGPLLNTLAGVAGGILAGDSLSTFDAGSGAVGASMEITSIIGNLLSSGLGGAALAVVLGFIKRIFTR